jgi:Skp family chaperone for outer membrane proteins
MLKKSLLTVAATLAPLALMTAMPAAAQISKIATADPAVAIAGTTAFGTAYSQINTQYQAFTAQMQEKDTRVQTLTKTLDTNGDNQLDDAEQQAAVKNKKSTVDQIQALQQEIANLNAPRLKAERYVIEQIALQYAAAQSKVVTEKKIEALLAPDVFVVAAPAADITPAITAALNTAVPSVAVTPAESWQPQRQTVQLHQQIQQLIVASAIRQRQQQQQAGQQPASAAPTPQQPSGR